MIDAPFRYDACTPWSDGKRRAVDRKGRTCVLLCDDAPGNYPIMGYFNDGCLARWAKDGKWHHSIGSATPSDLVGPAPEAPREWWHNHYSNGVVKVFDTREEADRDSKCGWDRIECINVVEKRS